MCQTDLSLFDVGPGTTFEVPEEDVQDPRSLDEILASIAGSGDSQPEIFEALKSVAQPKAGAQSSVGPAGTTSTELVTGAHFVCPVCENPVDEAASACGNCGAKFAEAEGAQFECPVCNASVLADAERCPSCGAIFALDEQPRSPRPEAPQRPSPGRETPSTGRGALTTKELVDRLSKIRQSRRNTPSRVPSGDRKVMYRELPRIVNAVKGLLSIAKRIGVDIGHQKNTINDAIAAGKQRDVERALRTIADAERALNVAITDFLANRIEKVVSEANRLGATPEAAGLEKKLYDATQLLEGKNYDGTYDLVSAAAKIFQAQVPDYVAAEVALDREEAVLLTARELGMEVGDAERLLRQGRDELAKENYGAARKLADGVRTRLATNLKEFAQEEMRKARTVILDMKVRGGDLSKPIGILKAASVHVKMEDWSTALRYLKEFRRAIRAK